MSQRIGDSIVTIEANGLDIAAIHPRMGDKYSPNLFRWLTARSRKHRTWTSRVYKDQDGVLWIGMMDNGDLFGERLISVLCNGTRATGACWVTLGPLEEVVDFWERYTRDGRCAIDQDHTMYFRGDERRWQQNGDHRECLWCGHHRQRLNRWTEQSEQSRWEPVPAAGVVG